MVYEGLEVFRGLNEFRVVLELRLRSNGCERGSVENEIDCLSVDGVRGNGADGDFDVRRVFNGNVAGFELRNAFVHLEGGSPGALEGTTESDGVFDLGVDPVIKLVLLLLGYAEDLLTLVFFD